MLLLGAYDVGKKGSSRSGWVMPEGTTYLSGEDAVELGSVLMLLLLLRLRLRESGTSGWG